ncbi:ABC transporter substrate binding protein [Acetobacterium sp.]|uniref:ABC transporter substrate binding protein n=1 Tax=Acetobacterium sp. TaxID=1872094 RepID=UPI0035947A93
MKTTSTVIRVLLLLIVIPSLAIFFINSPIAAQEDAPNIMIIHSYDLSYQWTSGQDEGIRTTILESYPTANIYTENLDSKRISEAYIMSTQKDVFVDKYKNIDFDLILATDDIGLTFAIDVREQLQLNVPIAFSGVLENTVAKLVGDAKDITGVYEIRGFTRMIELMRTLQPEAKKVVIINDHSSSSKQLVEKILIAFDELQLRDDYVLEFWEAKSYADILKDVSTLEPDTAVYLISYFESADGVIKDGTVFCQEISAVATVPLYSLGENYFGAGLTGGEFLSALLQGNELGAIATELLAGTPVQDIPYSSKSTSYLGVDENMLRKFNLEKIVLPEDTVVINETHSFYESYRSLIWSVLLAFVILIIFIGILLKQRRIINRTNQSLRKQKDELQDLYDQVATSEEELIVQNEALLHYQEDLELKTIIDQLTGLKNRSALEAYAKNLLANDPLYHQKLLIAFIDLDNFKYINSNHGHHIGDIVLKQLSNRLLSLGEAYFVSRVGGDEFVIIYDYTHSTAERTIAEVLPSLKKMFALPIKVGENSISVKASIGYSLYPEDSQDYDELIIFADIAMYEAKRKQRGSTMRYTESLEKLFDNEYKMLNEIEKGIANDEFYLVFQPIMTLDGSQVHSFEALLRWNSSCYGPVSPNEFIPIAETGGQILALGDKVIDMAIDFIKMLQQNEQKVSTVSINISVVQFYEADFVSKLLAKLKYNNIKNSMIQLEIIESLMIHSYEIIRTKLDELKANNITVALDDFGTGYSSLAHISKLPIDIVKIDKQFIDDILEDKEGQLIIDTICALTKSLSLKTIAEGVETVAQLDYVKKCGCDFIQGYFYSKPLMANDAIIFIKKHQQSLKI